MGFKAHVKSVSDTLNSKILECQELKTNTKAAGLQEPPSFRQLITPSVRAMKCLVPGSPMRFQEHVRSARTAGPVQIIRGTMLPQATTTQNATGCPHQGIADDDTECYRMFAPGNCYGHGCVTGCSHQGIDDECCSASISEAICFST